MTAIFLPVIITSTKVIFSRFGEATIVLIAIPDLVSRLYSKAIFSSITIVMCPGLAWQCETCGCLLRKARNLP